MKRTIDVNGVAVDFAVSAALPRLYRIQCGRDISGTCRLLRAL